MIQKKEFRPQHTFLCRPIMHHPRYLYKITMECAPGLSPKQLIDKQLILEIKALLNSIDMTITKIAHTLPLPDQSYLCRYFKRQTGILPTGYRTGNKITTLSDFRL